jgi:DNA-binding IclR family transcriptional regulator
VSTSNEGTHLVKSLGRVLDILMSLRDGAERLNDISSRLNMSKSTTHRLLKTLEYSHLVTQDPINRRYYLGPLVFSLSSNPNTTHQSLIVFTYDEMKRLRDLSGETVALEIRIAVERMILEELPSPQSLRHTLGKGTFRPLYTGAGGKVLLSELPKSELEIILNNIKLVPFTPSTITDREELMNEIKETRRRGYATSLGELIPYSSSIAVPINNYVCPVALSVFGPASRFSNMEDILKEMKKAVAQISKRLPQLTWE